MAWQAWVKSWWSLIFCSLFTALPSIDIARSVMVRLRSASKSAIPRPTLSPLKTPLPSTMRLLSLNARDADPSGEVILRLFNGARAVRREEMGSCTGRSSTLCCVRLGRGVHGERCVVRIVDVMA